MRQKVCIQLARRISIEPLYAYGFIMVKAILCVYILTHFFIQPIYIQGTSMMPTIHEGSFAIASLSSFHQTDLERFDIVVLQHEDEILIKRIIALPKETLAYQKDQLYINGVSMKEPFLDAKFMQTQLLHTHTTTFTSDIETITLQEDEYFVMGDHRLNSYDSRDFGVIHKDQIRSNGIYVLF